MQENNGESAEGQRGRWKGRGAGMLGSLTEWGSGVRLVSRRLAARRAAWGKGHPLEVVRAHAAMPAPQVRGQLTGAVPSPGEDSNTGGRSGLEAQAAHNCRDQGG